MNSPSAERPQMGWRYLALALLLVMLLLVFGQVVGFDFVNFDDNFYVSENPLVLAGLSSDGTAWTFSTMHLSNWHPLTWLSLMLDAEIHGTSAGGYHLTNLLLHTVNVYLLLAVLWQMTGTFWRSVVVASLFAIHPLHVESVAWISERKDLLCVPFGLLAIAAYIRYTRQAGGKWYLASLFCFALSLLSKQMLVTLPFVMLLIDYWPLERTGVALKKLIWEKVPFLLLSFVFSVVIFLAQKAGGSTDVLRNVSLATRFANAVLVYGLYLFATVCPTGLAAFYPHPGAAISLVQVSIAAIVLVGVSVISVIERRKHPYLLMGWLWYLGTLVPVIGIVQVGRQQMADRYTYFPLIGIFIAVCWLVPSLWPVSFWRRPALRCLAVAVLMSLAFVAWKQTSYWRNSITLFERTLAVTENNPVAHFNLANAFLKLKQGDKAISQYQQILQIDPKSIRAHNNLADLLFQRGRHQEGLRHFRQAITIDPQNFNSHYNFARALSEIGRHDEAFAEFQIALRIDPDNADAHFAMANTLSARGDVEEAILHHQQAIKLAPTHADAHYNLANIWLEKGRHADAIRHYTEAVKFNPHSVQAHTNLGNALAGMERYDEAIQQYQRALRIDPNFAAARQNLNIVRQKTKLQ